MPAPVAPAGLTLTQPTAGDPSITLAWTHGGVDLDRFEILWRRVDQTVWKSFKVAPKADFNPSGSNYSVSVASPPSYVWAVRALSAGGDVSTSNPTATFTGLVDGLWLKPYLPGSNTLVAASQAWIGGPTPAGDAERAVQVFAIPSRREKVSQAGVLHLDEGPIEGTLFARHGLTGDQWLDRLRELIKDQHRFDLYLVTPRWFRKVELNRLAKTSTYNSGPAWRVTVPYRELA